MDSARLTFTPCARRGMRNSMVILLAFAAIILAGCGAINNLAKHDFDDGYYTLNVPGRPVERIFATITGDSITVYPLLNPGRQTLLDRANPRAVRLDEIEPGGYLDNSTFQKSSLDIDLTTILLKYRPSRSGVPPQLNASLNAAVNIGYKKDYFKVKTYRSPADVTTTSIYHFNYDAGLFAGFGITPVNPTVTRDQVAQEYDGIIFQKGIAAFIGFDGYNVGVGVGFDTLLGGNARRWVYNQKPWFGFFLGIANF